MLQQVVHKSQISRTERTFALDGRIREIDTEFVFVVELNETDFREMLLVYLFRLIERGSSIIVSIRV